MIKYNMDKIVLNRFKGVVASGVLGIMETRISRLPEAGKEMIAKVLKDFEASVLSHEDVKSVSEILGEFSRVERIEKEREGREKEIKGIEEKIGGI